MIATMSANSTLALVISILSASAAVVLVVAIRAVVEIFRVKSGAEGQPPGRIKV